jgi:hypothetical protein
MRLLALSLLAAICAAPVSAQPGNPIGPSFDPKSVRTENFDVVFETKVTTMPMPTLPLLLNQTPGARWDAIVCNADKVNRGAVKAEPTARFGYLDPNVCTMFANIQKLDLTTVDADKDWTARVFLRARK